MIPKWRFIFILDRVDNNRASDDNDDDLGQQRYPFPKCGIRKRKRMSQNEQIHKISDPITERNNEGQFDKNFNF